METVNATSNQKKRSSCSFGKLPKLPKLLEAAQGRLTRVYGLKGTPNVSAPFASSAPDQVHQGDLRDPKPNALVDPGGSIRPVVGWVDSRVSTTVSVRSLRS